LPNVSQKVPDETKLSDDEEATLKEFCSGIELEEIEFEDWNRCHEDLNIIIPLFISLGESQKGCSKELHFSREVISENEVEREKAMVMLDIPSLVENGYTLVYKALGSVQDVNRGDLRVIIRIKR
jgi:hypothetical protein